MEKLDYRQIIKNILEKHINYQVKNDLIEKQLIFDTDIFLAFRSHFMRQFTGFAVTLVDKNDDE